MDSDAPLSADEIYSEGPPADVHSRLQAQTPEYSRTTALDNFHSAFQSGKKLQQVLGFQPPEPFARPPPVPPDLEQRFVAGLREYGLDLVMPGGNPVEIIRQASNMQKKVTAGVALANQILDDIKEEMESPTKATHSNDRPGSSSGMTINHSVWTSKCEAGRALAHRFRHKKRDIRAHYIQDVDQCQQRTAMTNARPSTARHSEDNSGTEYDEDDLYDPHAAFGSTTTLVDSEPSHHGQSAVVDADVNDVPSNPYTRRMASHDLENHGTAQGSMGAGYKPPLRSSSLANVTHHTDGQDAGQLVKNYINKHFRTQSQTMNHAKPRGISAPAVLFPPQQVGREQAWDDTQCQRVASAPDSPTVERHVPGGAGDPRPLTAPIHGGHGVPASQSLTPIPSLPFSKKRDATSQGTPTARIRPDESTTGLPILDATQEVLWKTKFPGNTYALLTVILTWTLSMQRLHKKLRDPYLFSRNPAFPYPVKPPIHQKLVSVAFYDNSTIPHKEIRFIGPSDVVEKSYNEVDIFSASTPAQSDQDSRLCAMKRAMGLKSTSTASHTDGTGRWCYIILKGRCPNSPTTSGPHVMIAWPKSAMTNSSDCLHTVYPDVAPAARPPLIKALKRFSSLQNLASAMRLDKGLRAASSSAHLPAVEETEIKGGALMLKRRVVKMEKAGRIPLIEGYRIDLKSWEGWLQAVGRGKGKVIMWMEREQGEQRIREGMW